MEKDTHKTNVLFVYPKYPDGGREVLAIFTDHNLFSGAVASYAHCGQHGSCHQSFRKCVRATPEQYAPLAKELESLGYNLNILNK